MLFLFVAPVSVEGHVTSTSQTTLCRSSAAAIYSSRINASVLLLRLLCTSLTVTFAIYSAIIKLSMTYCISLPASFCCCARARTRRARLHAPLVGTKTKPTWRKNRFTLRPLYRITYRCFDAALARRHERAHACTFRDLRHLQKQQTC